MRHLVVQYPLISHAGVCGRVRIQSKLAGRWLKGEGGWQTLDEALSADKVICNDWDLFIFNIFDKFGQLARLILLRRANMALVVIQSM